MATAPGVFGGGTLVENKGRWYSVHEFPRGSGEYLAFQFNGGNKAYKTVKATVGPENWPPEFQRRNDSWFKNNVVGYGSAEEVTGNRNFYGVVRNIMEDAAAAAGVRDPSLAGRMASNKEMQQIMAQAVLGDWTPEQIRAEQRKTRFWTKTLYPGIDQFYGRTTEPERAWREYEREVSPILRQLGYEPDSNGTFNRQIAKMLNKGIDSQTFQTMAPTFILAKQNVEFAGILNQWAERDLGRNIGFSDWFGLMAGESIPELEAVAERAQLEWTAQNQGTQVSQAQIENLADRTQLSLAEAQRAFSEFNQSVLALGEEGLGKYGLSRDEVLSAAAGVTAASGRSVDEVKLLVAKTAREQALFDDEKINFYVGFNAQGTPNRPGLQTLSPEGA